MDETLILTLTLAITLALTLALTHALTLAQTLTLITIGAYNEGKPNWRNRHLSRIFAFSHKSRDFCRFPCQMLIL